MRSLTRREFLALSGRGFLAAELSRWLPSLPEQAKTASSQDYPIAAVAAGTNDDTPAEILKTALDGIGGIERFVQAGMTVAIKPNATWAYPPHTASSSDPDLLRALIGMVRKAGAARIIVMDHCSIEPGTAEAIRVSGIHKVVKEEGVEGLFPDRNNAPLSTYTAIDLASGKAFQKIGVIKAAVEVDLRINLAMTKTHNVTKMTMCLKHMMGFLQAPGRLHTALDQGIADLSTPSPIQAQLHILEALRVRLPYGSYRVCAGPETDITNPKVVRRVNQVVAGTDPVMIDSYATFNYFDMQPEELLYLVKAADSGVGMIDFQTALKDGRMKLFQVGAAIATEVPTAAATKEPAQAVPPGSTMPARSPSAGTPTPLPTATSMSGTGILPVGAGDLAGDAAYAGQEMIDPRPFLNKALIPAAGLVAGAGLVAASRRKSRKPGNSEDGGGDEG